MNISGKSLSCEEAKKRDIVNYLRELGFEPTRISRQHYWYLSPFRSERTASFKVNRDMNRWYDFGEGRGGNLIDFGILYFECSVPEFLCQLSGTNAIQQSFLQPERRRESKDEPIQILNVKSIGSPLLLSYLKKRKIDIDISPRMVQRNHLFSVPEKVLRNRFIK